MVSYAGQANTSETSMELGNHYKTDSNLSGNFGIWANGMVDDVGETAGNKYYGEFDIRYQSTDEAEENRSSYMAFDLATRLNNEDQFMFSVREALWEKRFDHSKLALGRTTLDWSHADTE